MSHEKSMLLITSTPTVTDDPIQAALDETMSVLSRTVNSGRL